VKIDIPQRDAKRVIVLKLILLILPLIVFGYFGFRKWRDHYGEGTVFGYYARYMTGKRATDDPFPVYAIKIACFLVWFILLSQLIF